MGHGFELGHGVEEQSPSGANWVPRRDRDDGRTVHRQVVNALFGMLRSGSHRVGDRLPGELTLVEVLGVGRSAVREAIRELVALDVLETRRGKGTFVRSQRPDLLISADYLAEIGDIIRFETFDQLLAYPGVHPVEGGSGRNGADPKSGRRVSEAGNAHLRPAGLPDGPSGGTVHNPPSPSITGGCARRAGHVGERPRPLRKALSIVWGVWRNEGGFDPPWGRGLGETPWKPGLDEWHRRGGGAHAAARPVGQVDRVQR